MAWCSSWILGSVDMSTDPILPDGFFRAKSFKGGWQVAAQKPKIQTLRVIDNRQ